MVHDSNYMLVHDSAPGLQRYYNIDAYESALTAAKVEDVWKRCFESFEDKDDTLTNFKPISYVVGPGCIRFHTERGDDVCVAAISVLKYIDAKGVERTLYRYKDLWVDDRLDEVKIPHKYFEKDVV